jgi:hypothetical protein
MWLAIALVILAASPDAGQGKYAPNAVIAAEEQLKHAGFAIGAASLCPDIEGTRVRAAVLKIQQLIDKGVDDNQQYYAANNMFEKSIDKGRDAIRKRKTDCSHAAQDFGRVEKNLGP